MLNLGTWAWLLFGVFTDDSKDWRLRRRLIGGIIRNLRNKGLAAQFARPIYARITSWTGCIGYAACLWLIKKPFGLDCVYQPALASPAPKAIYSEVITLFGLVLTNGIALTVSQQNATTHPPLLLMLLFSSVVILILIGMSVFVLARDEGDPSKHPYDRGSVMFARVFFVGSVVIAATFGILAWCGQLPGQDFKNEIPVEVGSPQRYTLKNSHLPEGVYVPAIFNTKGGSDQLRLFITLSDGLGKKWTVGEVRGVFEDGGKEVPMRPRPFLFEEDSKDKNRRVVHLEELKTDKRYTVKIYLEPRDKMVSSLEEAMAQITEKGLRVNVLTQSKK